MDMSSLKSKINIRTNKPIPIISFSGDLHNYQRSRCSFFSNEKFFWSYNKQSDNLGESKNISDFTVLSAVQIQPSNITSFVTSSDTFFPTIVETENMLYTCFITKILDQVISISPEAVWYEDTQLVPDHETVIPVSSIISIHSCGAFDNSGKEITPIN